MKLTYEFIKGVWKENPVFRLVLGTCPTLAVTNSVINGISMGLATLFVLVCSSTIISAIRKLIPKEIRLPCFIVVIATFVTVADIYLRAQFPLISKALGPYVPLIIVNCIIFARAEAFASKNPVLASFVDALGMSIGFIFALFCMSSVREILGTGCFCGIKILGSWFYPWSVMILPAGAFFAFGILIGIMNLITKKNNE